MERIDQQIKQSYIEVEVLPSQFDFLNISCFLQLRQIGCCRRPRYLQLVADKVDLRIGVAEEVIQQILRIDFLQVFPDSLFIFSHQRLDAVNKHDCFLRCFFNHF